MKALNLAVASALHTWGRYVILVRTPPEGKQTANMRSLHAEESRHIRDAVEPAGFVFSEEARIFHDSSDPRDWDASPEPRVPGEKVDRFALVFVRR
jgi:predicted methyltransferase